MVFLGLLVPLAFVVSRLLSLDYSCPRITLPLARSRYTEKSGLDVFPARGVELK
jgi:hypothetical protein